MSANSKNNKIMQYPKFKKLTILRDIPTETGGDCQKRLVRQSLIDAVNACATAIAVLWGKRGEWPIYDLEPDCGLLRIDVCGKLEVLEMSDVKRIIAIPETFDNDEFYSENAKD